MLTNMAQHAYEMVQRERKSINSAKQMLTKFRADETWIPCGLLYSEEDEKIFNTTKLYPNTAFGSTSQGSHVYAAPGTMNGSMSSDSSLECRNGSKTGMELGSANEIANASHYEPAAKSSNDAKYTSTNGVIRSDTSIREALPDTFRKGKGKENHVVMAHSKEPQIAKQEPTSEDLDEADKIMEDEIFKIVGPEVSVTGQTESEYPVNPGRAFLPETGVNGADSTEVRRQKASEGIEIESGSTAGVRDAPEANKEEDEVVEKDSESRPPPRRMRTRAQAQAASEPTASSRTETPDAWVPPEIHPLFMIPASAIPDKDYGLPPSEAEDTRRLLMAYVQKQEEVVRGAEKLYEGLMQAERQRRTVFRWCKAEGHVGEMSDGEDWYNKDEWGLEDNLRKGHNDDEEDTAVAGKKIRGRRV